MEVVFGVLFSGAVAAIVVGLITEYFARQRFRIENFERLRREFQDDPQLITTKEKLEPERRSVAMDDPEKRYYLEFFELVGVYWKEKLINETLLNEIFADYVLDMYERPDTQKFIERERNRLENDSYYENFLALAKWCDQKEQEEKKRTRMKRQVGNAPSRLRRFVTAWRDSRV